MSTGMGTGIAEKKVAVVTGASSGIGWEVARRAARQGWRVAVSAPSTPHLTPTRPPAVRRALVGPWPARRVFGAFDIIILMKHFAVLFAILS